MLDTCTLEVSVIKQTKSLTPCNIFVVVWEGSKTRCGSICCSPPLVSGCLLVSWVARLVRTHHWSSPVSPVPGCPNIQRSFLNRNRILAWSWCWCWPAWLEPTRLYLGCPNIQTVVVVSQDDTDNDDETDENQSPYLMPI